MYRSIVLFFIALLFIGCNKKETSVIDENPPMRMNGEAYGSTYHIVYYSHGVDLNEQIQEVLDKFDKSVNTYIPDSYLSNFNQSELGASVDPILIDMVRLSQNYNTKSKGYFDPSVAPLSRLWGFSGDGIKHIPSKSQIDSVMQFLGLGKVKIHKDSLSKLDPRIALSFNAMTGYVNDMVASLFNENNVESYLIEIGGEIIAKGKKPNGETWKVGIDSPLTNQDKREIYTTVALENEALATSGNYRKFYMDKTTGQKVGHTINPLTGQSEVSNLLSVTVISQSCAEADAIATATMAMGLEKAKEYVKQRKDLKFLLIWSARNGQLKSETYNGFETLDNLHNN